LGFPGLPPPAAAVTFPGDFNPASTSAKSGVGGRE
jgi:hypothetical protein